MRPTTATLGIRVTGSVTLRELYGARGAGIRAIAPPFGPHGTQAPFMSSRDRGWKRASRMTVKNVRGAAADSESAGAGAAAGATDAGVSAPVSIAEAPSCGIMSQPNF